MYVGHWTHNATAADWDPLQRKYSAKASMSFRVSGRAGWAGSNLFHPDNVRRDNPKAFLSKGSASERNAIRRKVPCPNRREKRGMAPESLERSCMLECTAIEFYR
ncbi:hypothetical protein FGB62_177g03 [Gracilaria domingensis]|nr:hypothetical protein FGB62_177g03 [Gracilaria domingensis]